MKWILLLPLAAASVGAQARAQALLPTVSPTVDHTAIQTTAIQTYVKPYSLSIGVAQKFEHKIIGPTVTTSPYEFDDAVSIGVNYRTPQDRIKLGLSYTHTLQNGTNAVSAEIRYNILQWGRRPVKRDYALAP